MSGGNSSGVANLVLNSVLCWAEIIKRSCLMQCNLKMVHYISLISEAFTQEFEGLVVSSPFDKMLFNGVLFTCSHYFIYFELDLW